MRRTKDAPTMASGVFGPLTTNIRHREFEVDQNYHGWRLDYFLVDRIPRLSRTRANDIIRHGDIAVVPERKLKPATRLQQGDVIILREHLPMERVQDDEVQILLADKHLLVLNKPAGMLVHEAGQVRLNTVQEYLYRAGYTDAEPAHRIDRETSGIVVCAMRAQTLPVLRRMFAESEMHKTYRTLVRDAEQLWPVDTTRTIDFALGLDPHCKLGIRMTHGDLQSLTHARCLHRGEFAGSSAADLEVRIETGRQHQIRAHLKILGTPVIGDKLYTFDEDFFIAITENPDDPERLSQLGAPRHLLHAWKIAFAHPVTGQMVDVVAPLPSFWEEFTRDDVF